MPKPQFNTFERSSPLGGLVGYLTCPYCKLVERLGEPQTGFYGKSDALWIVTFTSPIHAAATIYNWKDGRAYLGEDGLPLERIRDWHIGGRSPEVVPLIGYILDQPVELFIHRE